MKIKKFVVYILAAVFVAAMQPNLYAEGSNDAIIVIPWDSGTGTSESEPPDISDREVNDPSNPSETEPQPTDSEPAESTVSSDTVDSEIGRAHV